MAACRVPINAFFDDFDGEDFHNTRAIRFMQAVPHRYGHTSNISRLLEGTEEDPPNDYLKGLVATSITIFIFFVCWMLVLLLFKCLGPSKVGGLSGRLSPLPPKPDDEQQEEFQQWDQVYQLRRIRLNVARGAVIFSGLSIIVAAVLMAIFG
jgi:hypothetical protein